MVDLMVDLMDLTVDRMVAMMAEMKAVVKGDLLVGPKVVVKAEKKVALSVETMDFLKVD